MDKKIPVLANRNFLEATTRFELVIRVLQTHALPLGYVAILKMERMTRLELATSTLARWRSTR